MRVAEIGIGMIRVATLNPASGQDLHLDDGLGIEVDAERLVRPADRLRGRCISVAPGCTWVSGGRPPFTSVEPTDSLARLGAAAQEHAFMAGHQGDLALLNDPIAQALLQSTIPARLAYSWTDGTPRVVPIWFHWTGEEFVLGSPPGAPKLKALATNSAAALTIDENAWPPKVLLVRGSASVQLLDDVSPEYAAAATRYFGEEQGRA